MLIEICRSGHSILSLYMPLPLALEFQGQRKIKERGSEKTFKHAQQCNVNALKVVSSSKIWCVSLEKSSHSYVQTSNPLVYSLFIMVGGSRSGFDKNIILGLGSFFKSTQPQGITNKYQWSCLFFQDNNFFGEYLGHRAINLSKSLARLAT